MPFFSKSKFRCFLDGFLVDCLVHVGSILAPFGDILDHVWTLFAKTAFLQTQRPFLLVSGREHAKKTNTTSGSGSVGS